MENVSFSAKVKEELENKIDNRLCCDLAQENGFSLFSRDNMDSRSSINWDLLNDECCKTAFLRGVFLASGYVANPEKTYHLEFVAPYTKLRKEFAVLLESFGLSTKWVARSGSYVFYYKDSEVISDILGLLGANKSLLDFMNIKIEKEDKGNINRRINVEIANYDKTAMVAARQIAAINEIGLENLPLSYKKSAEARIKHPDKSLAELAGILGFSKAKVNYDLRNIENMIKK